MPVMACFWKRPVATSFGGSAARDLPQAPSPPRPTALANAALVRSWCRLYTIGMGNLPKVLTPRSRQVLINVVGHGPRVRALLMIIGPTIANSENESSRSSVVEVQRPIAPLTEASWISRLASASFTVRLTAMGREASSEQGIKRQVFTTGMAGNTYEGLYSGAWQHPEFNGSRRNLAEQVSWGTTSV